MSDQEAVAKRFERLERQCRHLRITVVALGIAFVAVVGVSMSPIRPAIGQQEPTPTADVIRTHRLVLMDAAGRRVAELGPSKEESGIPALSFYREDGRLGAMLGADGKQNSVLMLNGKGSESMSLCVENGGGGIGFQAEDGTDMFGLGADKTGNILCMNDSSGHCRIEVSAPGKGTPSITLREGEKVNILKP